MKGSLLYEGKAKKIYSTEDPNIVLIQYKNSITAFNGQKKEEIEGKGELNNRISSQILQLLTEKNIPNHFIKVVSPTEQLVKKVEIIPLEVVVRNIVAGSLAKRVGLPEGTNMMEPLVEFYYKNDDLGDPLLTNEHIKLLNLISERELEKLRNIALKINDILIEFFKGIHVNIVDFKLEFGKDVDGEILLADEISPDTCRLWDMNTKKKLDKDVFRRNLGSLTEAYQNILSRMKGEDLHV
jgi:phosphoribosylaminoimidazole-succinocarboxamide synthase